MGFPRMKEDLELMKNGSSKAQKGVCRDSWKRRRYAALLKKMGKKKRIRLERESPIVSLGSGKSAEESSSNWREETEEGKVAGGAGEGNKAGFFWWHSAASGMRQHSKNMA